MEPQGSMDRAIPPESVPIGLQRGMIPEAGKRDRDPSAYLTGQPDFKGDGFLEQKASR